MSAFKHDVFVTYARANNHDGWVKTFVEELKKLLTQQLDAPANVYFDDESIDRNEAYDAAIESAVEKSEVLVVVGSNKYLTRPWCEFERNTFMKQFGDSQIVLLRYEDVSLDALHQVLPKHLGHDFFDEDGRRFDFKSAEFNSAIHKLCKEIVAKLNRAIQSRGGGGAPPQIEASGRNEIKEVPVDLSLGKKKNSSISCAIVFMVALFLYLLVWTSSHREIVPPTNLQESLKRVATILKRNEEQAPSLGEHEVRHYVGVSNDVMGQLDATNIIEWLAKYVDEKAGSGELAIFDLPSDLSDAGLLDRQDDEIEFKSNDFFVGHLAFYIINRIQCLGKANDTSVDNRFRGRAWKAVVPLLFQYFRQHWDHWNDHKPSEDKLIVNGEKNDSVYNDLKPGWYGIDWNLKKSPSGSHADVTWNEQSKEWRLEARGVGFLRNTIAIIDLDRYPNLSWTWRLDQDNKYDNGDRVADSPGMIKLWLVEKSWINAISVGEERSTNDKLRVLGIYFHANKKPGSRKYKIDGILDFPNKLADLDVHLFDIEKFEGKVDRDLREDFAVAFPGLTLSDFVVAAITVGADHPRNGETNKSTLGSIIFSKQPIN